MLTPINQVMSAFSGPFILKNQNVKRLSIWKIRGGVSPVPF